MGGPASLRASDERFATAVQRSERIRRGDGLGVGAGKRSGHGALAIPGDVRVPRKRGSRSILVGLLLFEKGASFRPHTAFSVTAWLSLARKRSRKVVSPAIL